MRLRHSIYLTMLGFLLVACGRSDTASTESIEGGIAHLLRQPPPAGTAVEIDVYNWLPDRRDQRVTYAHDSQGCPLLTDISLLTDKPVPGFLSLLGGGTTNWSAEYPALDSAWLIPVAIDADSAQTYPPPQGQPAPSVFPLPGHARIRGHVGDPAFAKCPHADRIFVVERVVTVYTQSARVGSGFHEPLQLPPDYAQWPRYHDAALGYSIAYPPDWQVEPLREAKASGIAIRGAQWPNNPFTIRIYSGETHYDQYQNTTLPPLLNSDDVTIFNQEVVPIAGDLQHQHLDGYIVRHYRSNPSSPTIAVVLNAQGRSYELMLSYPAGLDAQQALLDTYSLMVVGFRFDSPVVPSPTPPIKQQLGPGPFLSQEAAFTRARSTEGDGITLIEAEILPEAAARERDSGCGIFQGHPDGVWLLTVSGLFADADRHTYIFLDATTGAKLCGAEISPSPLPPTMTPSQDN